MKLPRYFICGVMAVKFEELKDEVVILVYDEKENVFIENIDYLEIALTSNDSEEVTEEEFNAYIEKLKNK